MHAPTTIAAGTRASHSFWGSVSLAVGRGAVATALLLAGSQGAFATYASPPTVQCTGKCQACTEMEATPDGAGRCLKCGVDPMCLGNDGGYYDAATNLLNAH